MQCRHGMFAIGLGAMLLAGCSSHLPWRKPVQPLAYYQMTPTTTDGGSAGRQASKSPSAELKHSSARERELPVYIQEVFADFSTSAQASRKDPTNPELAAKFMDHGMGLTNLLCSEFMLRATQQRQHRNYERDLASNVNTAISAVLNLTKSSNLATGLVSAVFGGIDANYQSWDSHYVAAVDLATAEALVRSAMAEQSAKNHDLANLSYSQVEGRLIQYANTCSFNGIKTLVNQSVTAGALNIQVDNAGAATVGSETVIDGRREQASAKQAAGFAALGECRWDDAQKLFEEAERIYPTFQVSHEYATALRDAKKSNASRAAAVQVTAEEVGRVPDDVLINVKKNCQAP